MKTCIQKSSALPYNLGKSFFFINQKQLFYREKCSWKFRKIHSLRPAILFKKRLWYRCFSVHVARFSKTSFLQSTSGRLLLINVYPNYPKEASKFLNFLPQKLLLQWFRFIFFVLHLKHTNGKKIRKGLFKIFPFLQMHCNDVFQKSLW